MAEQFTELVARIRVEDQQLITGLQKSERAVQSSGRNMESSLARVDQKSRLFAGGVNTAASSAAVLASNMGALPPAVGAATSAMVSFSVAATQASSATGVLNKAIASAAVAFGAFAIGQKIGKAIFERGVDGLREQTRELEASTLARRAELEAIIRQNKAELESLEIQDARARKKRQEQLFRLTSSGGGGQSILAIAASIDAEKKLQAERVEAERRADRQILDERTRLIQQIQLAAGILNPEDLAGSTLEADLIRIQRQRAAALSVAGSSGGAAFSASGFRGSPQAFTTEQGKTNKHLENINNKFDQLLKEALSRHGIPTGTVGMGR